MAYLRNTWYVAAWSHEIGEQPFGRTILEEKIVFYRQADGKLVAARNICPHRFAPLDRGRVVEDTIECAYHGLRFNGQGKCVFNPDGDGKVPSGATLTIFPVVERWKAVWIWMGDPSRADASLIPDYTFLDTPEFHPVLGLLDVRANYRYIVDNLVDIAHVRMLHANSIYCEMLSNGKTEVIREPDGGIWANRLGQNGAPPPLFSRFWLAAGRGELPDRMDHWADARWNAPSLVLNQLGIAKHGDPREAGLEVFNTHFLTPESETSTHYFWSNSRPFQLDNPHLDAEILAGTERLFVHEDEIMLHAVQESMGDREFWSMKPVLLQSDVGAVAIRRSLDKMIADEQQETVTS
ncbi:Rieske 2Fe-2S domain-containing protein [Paraburkholderia sediminicola]|uniref:Rieske 2Fe-2S domain-containing protein n=1 Tax=Paraburkholderia sediminicola TaxID=458836 RepID=UPI0038B721AC